METFDTSKPAWLLARDIHIANQQRENEKQSKFQQRQNDNVMNSPKNYDQIQDLKKSDFFSTVKQTLDRNKKVGHSTKDYNTKQYIKGNKNLF